jgi:hypothetical protein
LAAAAARLRRFGTWETLALAFLGVLWLMLVRNKVNIGLRYALLTYPIAAVFIARQFGPALARDRVWTPICVLALAWFAWVSIGCGTRCLSYFNELAGGPRAGAMFLSDSNIDWGQDFDRLAVAVERLGIRELTTDLLGERRLVLPGVAALVFPARNAHYPDITPPNRRLYDAEGGFLPVYTRYMAVSHTRLAGLYTHNDMSWLLTRRLVQRVGESILIFDMDEPARGRLYP